jgi:transcriptional regulator with XRE-family HTH domain
MPEIGATLREARMRLRIDISEIEAQTKIRAKYLRALENEEWNLLPGTTYVKSFLRTYAEALGLDAKLLVEEYKLRHERLSDVELQPIVPTTALDRRKRPTVRLSRGWAIGLVVGALVILLAIVGISSNDSGGGTEGPSSGPSRTETTATSSKGTSTTSKKSTPAAVRLQLVPHARVYVCLVAAGERRLIPGLILTPGRQPTYRSSRFLMRLGNGSVDLRINGRVRDVPEVRAGIGYELTRQGRKVLPPERWPTCGK